MFLLVFVNAALRSVSRAGLVFWAFARWAEALWGQWVN